MTLQATVPLDRALLQAVLQAIVSGEPAKLPAAPGLWPRSLTRTAQGTFVAMDTSGGSKLLQAGGEPVAGLGPAESVAAGAWLYSFTPQDRAAVAYFAQHLDRKFLPRPQGAQPAIAVGNRHPEFSLPAAFEAFQKMLDRRGVNLASTVQLSATREMTTDEAIAARDGSSPTAPGHTRVSIQHLYHAGLWAAIRAGFREGYNAEADHFIVTGKTADEIAQSVECVKEAIRQARGYTKFTTDTSRLFDLRADTRSPDPYSDVEIKDLFSRRLHKDERAWVLDAFSRRFDTGEGFVEFSVDEIERLSVKFGESLKLNEALYDAIAHEKAGERFDFEPSLDEAETLTTAKELFFYMHWLQERGRPAQLVPPNLGFKKRQAYPDSREALVKYAAHKMWPELLPRVEQEFGGDPVAEFTARVRELAGVARYFDGTLSIHSGSGKQAAILQAIGEATSARLNYKISGELQLQLFDVLSEQNHGTPERALFLEMVEACERFAEAGAFGEESALAAPYRASHGPYLGKASRGRVDGNLFLVFWLGNMVGSKDAAGVFFKDRLDALPAAIVEESRRRNTEYIQWLAASLMGWAD
jgi:hypothetical protein